MDRRTALVGLGSLLLTGCAAGEDFTPPTMKLSDSFTGKSAEPIRKNDAKWWQAFNDPVINRLVEQGLQQNLDVKRYAARIQQSQGVVDGAGFPISGNARVAESRIDAGGGNPTVRTGFVRTEASWKIDLFGRLKREREAAFARLDAAYAELDVWKLLFVEEVVAAYIDLRYAQELLRIQIRVLDTRQSTLDTTLKLANEGNATDLEVAQSRSLVLSTQSNIPEARIEFVKRINRIVALVGTTELANREDLDVKAPQPVAKSHIVSTGVPADLLRNRPDIVRAEQRLAESVALLGLTKADLYPQLVLTGNVNVNVSGAEVLPGAGFLRLGLDLPIFDLPVRKARIETAKGLIAERQADWEKEVVLAVEEVRNAIYGLSQHQIAVEASREAVIASREVLSIAQRRFAEGSVSFLQVLDAERSLLNNENAYALDVRNQARDFVKLNVSLGGSFAQT
ncbi:efflux transporter outer membrane subunit [Halocynthiibacter sp. C4]|uniref:efflux transporter outer membrane subunit n=1 Tax=Halocynthiibacter sp. C4 TaxID=2992758 RepID=UPI00237A0EE0|nr:efflux transporter outer membrane subunit [Halocynthiibacter sp. C4]MDE0588802.1 efflux transporter outer membrane subunit [Halocynthiibacter sp. C4]